MENIIFAISRRGENANVMVVQVGITQVMRRIQFDTHAQGCEYLESVWSPRLRQVTGMVPGQR